MLPRSRKDPSIAVRRECEERVESQEARAGLKAQGLREGPAEIKRTACHTSAVVLIRGSSSSTTSDSLINLIGKIGFTMCAHVARDFSRKRYFTIDLNL